jgi:hypothetical protein
MALLIQRRQQAALHLSCAISDEPEAFLLVWPTGRCHLSQPLCPSVPATACWGPAAGGQYPVCLLSAKSKASSKVHALAAVQESIFLQQSQQCTTRESLGFWGSEVSAEEEGHPGG